MEPKETYLSFMETIQERFDSIDQLKNAPTQTFSQAEASALHGRKIVEAIAFACLVALENGLKNVPRDAKGQWSAESIFKSLKSKGITVLPSPSVLRHATPEEQKENNVKFVIDGIRERRLSHEDLIAIYQSLHAWLHEVNPYVHASHAAFLSSKSSKLWAALRRLRLFVERHCISIQGEDFFSVLWDAEDGKTKIGSLSKAAA